MNDKGDQAQSDDKTLVRRVVSLRREGRLRVALDLIDELQTTQIATSEIWRCLQHLKAEVLQDEGRYSEAVAAYNGILHNSTDPVAYGNRGLAYLSLGDWERSLADYLSAISIEPTDSVALEQIGDILIRQERYDEAIGYLRRAHELNPQSVSILNSLGIAYHNTEDWMEAYRFLKMSLRLEPGNKIATLGIKKMDEHLELKD